jgi:hypothetical protein
MIRSDEAGRAIGPHEELEQLPGIVAEGKREVERVMERAESNQAGRPGLCPCRWALCSGGLSGLSDEQSLRAVLRRSASGLRLHSTVRSPALPALGGVARKTGAAAPHDAESPPPRTGARENAAMPGLMPLLQVGDSRGLGKGTASRASTIKNNISSVRDCSDASPHRASPPQKGRRGEVTRGNFRHNRNGPFRWG